MSHLSTIVRLVYDPGHTATEVRGWYLPCCEPSSWLAAVALESTSTTQYYLAPVSLRDSHADGLIALREANSPANLPTPPGAVPLSAIQDVSNRITLWLPWMTGLAGKVPARDLLDQLQATAGEHYVWLPPDVLGDDRLIGLHADDAIDLSMLVKPPRRADSAEHTLWLAPPTVPTLPERLAGLQIHPSLIAPNSFIQEQQSIGGDGDDLMSIDEQGRSSGGGMGSMAGRMFRQGLMKIIKTIEGLAQGKSTEKTKGSDEPTPRSPKSQPVQKKVAGGTGSLLKQMQHMLNAQREKQLKKLLALMARDPDRALKYAIPMGPQAAPRGMGQPGSQLGTNNVDFSLDGLFGGGRPADLWRINYELQAKLQASYRAQADRELAAGRYRRAAYILAHLLGDLSNAARVLENGKFFLEALALYRHLQRPLDQARCLRASGQLAESAEMYESLKQFETAAEIWSSINNHTAATNAYEKACSAALEAGDVFKAVKILDANLRDPVRAEELLWQQWPRGQKPVDCMRLAFERLATQARIAEAHQRLEEVIAQTGPAEQTSLAILCRNLHASFPDRQLRTRAEDQCRLSAVHRVQLLSNEERRQRMNILSSLHPHDLQLQRDVRRFERDQTRDELKLQPETGKSKVGPLRALSSLKLASGQYYAAKIIRQHLLTISRAPGQIVFSRYASLSHSTSHVHHCKCRLDAWDKNAVPCIHFHTLSDPVNVRVGYVNVPIESQLLTSPLGGDDFWILNCVDSNEGQLVGIGDDGSEWYWDSHEMLLTRRLHNLPQALGPSETLRLLLLQKLMETHDDDVSEPHTLDFAQSRCELLLHNNKAVIAYGKSLISAKGDDVQELAQFRSPIRWMVGSMPQTRPRLLVATTDGLYMVMLDGAEPPECILRDMTFTKASFLSSGFIAATTESELLLFRRSTTATRLVDRQPLQMASVVDILALTAETVGVLFDQGLMQRWRLNH